MSDYEAEQYNKYIIGSLANMATPPVDDTENIPVDGVVRPIEVYNQLPVGSGDGELQSQNIGGKILSAVKNVATDTAGAAADLGVSLTKGASLGSEFAIRGMGEIAGLPIEGINAFSNFIGIDTTDPEYQARMQTLFASKGLSPYTGKEFNNLVDQFANFTNNNIPGVKTLNQEMNNYQYNNETFGMIGEIGGQFAITALPAANIVKGLTSTNAIVRGFMWGGIADYFSFNPEDETLTVMLTEYIDGASEEERSILGNAIVKTFEKHESDPAVVKRFKSAVDGAIIGGKAEGLIKLLGVTARKVPWGKTIVAGGAGGVAMQPDEASPFPIGKLITRLLQKEKALLTEAAKKVNDGVFSKDIFNAAREKLLQIKNNFPSGEGWVIPTLAAKSSKPAFKINKKGEIEINWQKLPWKFHIPKNKRTNKKTHKKNMVNTMVSDVNELVKRAQAGDKDAIAILKEANWYRVMRSKLRTEFGGMGDLFADILGATSAQTNVRQNWNNAIEVIRRFTKGEFDEEIAMLQKRIDAGEDVSSKTLYQLAKDKKNPFELITKASGQFFGANSPAATMALLDVFRQIKQGKSPKTINFTGNLIGFTNEATIDVWAARYLRKIAGYPRLATVSEQGVSGTHLTESTFENPQIGAEFGFGQQVFGEAKDIINQSGVIKNYDASLGDLGADDLQAVIWFLEKDLWGKNKWTSEAGGSVDYEAKLAGNINTPEWQRVEELRTILNTEGTSDAVKAAAEKELKTLEASLQRTVGGLSLERKGAIPSGQLQADKSQELIDTVKDDPNVIANNINSTYGEYQGVDELSFNIEVVGNKNFNADSLTNKVVEMAREYDQDSAFVSRVVPDDTPNALPGYEIYFTQKQKAEFIKRITAILRENDIDGFTFISDARQSDRAINRVGEADPVGGLVGVRFQYIPEFDELYDGTNLAERIKAMEVKHNKVVSDLLDDFPEINLANPTYYDTTLFVNRDRPGMEWLNGGTSYEEYLGKKVGSSAGGQSDQVSTTNTKQDSGGEVRNDSAGDLSGRVDQSPQEQGTSSLKKKTDLKGITAYHGSGKDFDQFSFEEIGTGTGETFFGYGLYFDTDKALAMNFKGKDGKVYKVDLKVADNEVINAEIPLNEQPEKIQNALIKYYKRYNVDESKPVSDLIAKMPNNPASINYNETKLFAQNLSKDGIKALKYKKLSHPSKKKPSDTFVVFDDKVIDILTKLGIAGAVILTPEMKGTVLTNSQIDA